MEIPQKFLEKILEKNEMHFRPVLEGVGGIEFQVIQVYAKKFGFTPELMRATGYDNEGSVVDMVGTYFKIVS